jgi:hypothetical protein
MAGVAEDGGVCVVVAQSGSKGVQAGDDECVLKQQGGAAVQDAAVWRLGPLLDDHHDHVMTAALQVR